MSQNNRNEQWSPAKQVFGCLVALVVLVGVPAGCIYGFNQWMKSPLHEVAESVDDYRTLCSERPIPGAPAYEPGSGPHPIAVFEDVRNDDSHRSSQVHFTSAEVDEAFDPSDPGQVQLVACAERVDEGDQVGTCEFTSETVPVHSSTVEVRVYEARTAEEVAEPIELTSESTECPGAMMAGGSPTLYSLPTAEQFASALGAVVNS